MGLCAGIQDVELILCRTAAQLALSGQGNHVVDLDTVIRAMRDTARDMHEHYKETSLGGLAVSPRLGESGVTNGQLMRSFAELRSHSCCSASVLSVASGVGDEWSCGDERRRKEATPFTL